jgi:ribonuclease HI
VILRHGRDIQEINGGEEKTTNNQMELRAAIEGLRALEDGHTVELYTDSEYVRKGITQWMKKWRSNGWQTASKKPVRNAELWQELSAELERHEVRWHWVKGHSGDRWNERADELASRAIPRLPLPVDDPKAVHLFLGVAHSGKMDAGGWSALMAFGDSEKTISARVPGASANQMHLQGAVAGLAELKRPVRVHVYTVSDYLKDGASTWLGGWRSRGWRTREGRPVAHAKLWQQIDRLQQRHRVTWHVASRDLLPEEMVEAKRLAKEVLTEEE